MNKCAQPVVDTSAGRVGIGSVLRVLHESEADRRWDVASCTLGVSSLVLCALPPLTAGSKSPAAVVCVTENP